MRYLHGGLRMVSCDGAMQSEIEARIEDASKIMSGKQGEGAGLY